MSPLLIKISKDFALKVSSMGSVKTQTMRAFRREEMEEILAKIK
jgi:uncharacterized protein with GYD domain